MCASPAAFKRSYRAAPCSTNQQGCRLVFENGVAGLDVECCAPAVGFQRQHCAVVDVVTRQARTRWRRCANSLWAVVQHQLVPAATRLCHVARAGHFARRLVELRRLGRQRVPTIALLRILSLRVLQSLARAEVDGRQARHSRGVSIGRCRNAASRHIRVATLTLPTVRQR